MSEKQNIINDIYFDRAGFGSKATTLKDAKAKDPSIRMEDVEEFFRKNVEVKKKTRGENSFIPPEPYHEYQLDLFFISRDDMEIFDLCWIFLLNRGVLVLFERIVLWIIVG